MIRRLYEKYRDLIPYVFFGVLTTLVNTGVYWLCAHPLGMPVLLSTVIAWFVAVLFAYLTNRKWVFHSEAVTAKEIAREVISFYLCRLATGLLDWGLMYLLVERLHCNDMVVKVAVIILVIILNYVASKLLVFRKKTMDEPGKSHEKA